MWIILCHDNIILYNIDIRRIGALWDASIDGDILSGGVSTGTDDTVMNFDIDQGKLPYVGASPRHYAPKPHSIVLRV